MSQLETQLTELETDLKAILSKQTEFLTKQSVLQRQVDAIDLRVQGANGGSFGPGGGVDLAAKIWESGEFKALAANHRGRAILTIPDMSLKTLTSATVGADVMLPQRVGGVVTEARRQLRLRDLLTIYPASGNSVDFVQVSEAMTKASPVAESYDKPEVSMNFETVNEPIRTIAAWVAASVQILDDSSQLKAAINSALAFAVLAEEENQLLHGDGSSQALHGLMHQAQVWDVSALNAADGWEYVDAIGGAVAQIVAADELQPNFVCLNPSDWWKIRRTKSSTGEYIWGPPSNGAPGTMWELQVLPTTAMSLGTFLVGSSSPQACAIFERMGMTIDISTEHSDFFVKNLCALRGECRTAICVFRPNSFCQGSLTQSPL